MNALAVNGLTKTYPSFTLDHVSFTLGRGRIMGLIGKNGAGKSTTIKSILHLVSPDSGRVEVLGMDMADQEAACKQAMGVVLGGAGFYQHKKLSAITAVTSRFYRNWDRAAYERYLREFELDPGKQVRERSTGMQVKYQLALALSHQAELLILDEPTSGLDPVSRDALLELFRALAAGGERSILFSTHITSDLDRCADDITYIKDGRVLASGEKGAFLDAFQHLRTDDEPGPLCLEDIMIRTERGRFHV